MNLIEDPTRALLIQRSRILFWQPKNSPDFQWPPKMTLIFTNPQKITYAKFETQKMSQASLSKFSQVPSGGGLTLGLWKTK